MELARRVPAPPTRQRRRPGRGIEPGSRRAYAPGDDVRLIDWPAYARLERLLVKVTEELPEPRLELVVDGSASMGCGHPSPHLRACLAAAALGACAVARQVHVNVWFAGPSADRATLHRPGQLVGLLRTLDGWSPGGEGRLDACAERVRQANRVRGGALVLSDGLQPEPVAAAVQRLASAGFRTLVVLVGAAAELDPSLAAQATGSGLAELVDAETGARRQVPFSELALELAAARRAERAARLAALLEPTSVGVETLAPDAPFESVALGLLRG